MATTNALYTTTYDTGGVAKASPEVTVVPERARTTEDFAQFAGGQLNAPFIADFLSAALTHEQCGRHLYRSVAGRTQNPVLKSRYEHFGTETERHIDILFRLITELGGEPGYVSPSARATEKLDQGALEATFMLDGSLDILTRELAMLDAVVLAETIDNSNWELIAELTDKVEEGPIRSALQKAVDEVGPQETEHVMWAIQTRRRLIMKQATHPMVAGATATAEAALDWVKGLLSGDDAARA
jgi:rubrerythrin